MLFITFAPLLYVWIQEVQKVETLLNLSEYEDTFLTLVEALAEKGLGCHKLMQRNASAIFSSDRSSCSDDGLL